MQGWCLLNFSPLMNDAALKSIHAAGTWTVSQLNGFEGMYLCGYYGNVSTRAAVGFLLLDFTHKQRPNHSWQRANVFFFAPVQTHSNLSTHWRAPSSPPTPQKKQQKNPSLCQTPHTRNLLSMFANSKRQDTSRWKTVMDDCWWELKTIHGIIQLDLSKKVLCFYLQWTPTKWNQGKVWLRTINREEHSK